MRTLARISVLLTLAVAAAGCATEPSTPPAVGDRVTVAQGGLRGTDDRTVVAFQGIPYAAPPTGAARWTAPRPADAWPGERDATRPGPRCPQTGPSGALLGDEDCLTLAVHGPSGTRSGAKRPVLVWIHGGGLNVGGADETDPRRLVTEGGIVVVSINYRLGALGFLSVPGLPGGGTFGLRDQQLALRWVQQNIAAFGGDPGRVTLYGVSAGGDSVCSHLASPASRGLFHRAILGSSACHGTNALDTLRPGLGPAADTWKPLPVLDGLGTTYAAGLGCPDANLDCLRALPTEKVAAANVYYWSPATGTETLPRRPSEAIAAGEAADVPVLMGIVRDEGASLVAGAYAAPPLDEARFTEFLSTLAGPRAEAAKAAYPLAGRTPNRAFADVYGDRSFACPNMITYRDLGDRVWVYELTEPDLPAFRFTPPPDMAGTTAHGADLSMIFTVLDDPRPLTEPQQRLARQMRAYWAAFVTTGEPRADGAPTWPAYGDPGTQLNLRAGGTVAEPAEVAAERHHCAVW
ncbi:carboxylesterase/lipase family protein [Catenuloplanes atrovinosus]|uniref:Carboxylic ester hydrolase n=1 Tax=Catenuloplanes atrovinosus TaxID=137266 RepID=A0AAE3YQ09_9ACTN|nr:carboxylesterase family protein [Catenuloplanes atrovinosus]MDR7276466.1 para-nitrobenzyl esterase [Catenuloplanes atrovinosus]